MTWPLALVIVAALACVAFCAVWFFSWRMFKEMREDFERDRADRSVGSVPRMGRRTAGEEPKP